MAFHLFYSCLYMILSFFLLLIAYLIQDILRDFVG